jgi:hypothetical protein
MRIPPGFLCVIIVLLRFVNLINPEIKLSDARLTPSSAWTIGVCSEIQEWKEELGMQHSTTLIGAIAFFGGILSAAAADRAKREMNVTQGPETIFPVPVEQIFPELEGATATGPNGRVGNELVFWEHRLRDGREAYLVACLISEEVDCAGREQKICPGPTVVLARTISPGRVREVKCTSIATVAPGDVLPGCTDRERSQELAVSLHQCR